MIILEVRILQQTNGWVPEGTSGRMDKMGDGELEIRAPTSGMSKSQALKAQYKE